MFIYNRNILRDINDKKIEIILFFLVFFINSLVAIQLNDLYVIGDEFCVLANTAYFAGDNFSELVRVNGYYGYVQALLYLPLYIIFENKLLFYKATLIVNAILVSIIPVICYKILIEILEVKDKKFSVICSSVIGCIPTALILSKWSWNEPILFILVWLILYFILKETKNIDNTSKIKGSTNIAFLLVIGYASNGRFIGVICSVILIIVISHIIKRPIIKIIPFVGTMVVLLTIDSVIKQNLLTNLWLLGEVSQNTTNTINGALSTVIPYVLSLEGIKRVFTLLIGQTWYIFVSTFGLIPIGIACIVQEIYRYIRYFRKNSKCDEQTYIIFIFGCFSILIVMAGLAIGVLNFLPEQNINNSTAYIYGRYTESLIGPVILYGLYYCKRNYSNRKIVIGATGLYGIVSILFYFIVSKQLLACTTQINDVNVLGIYPFKYYLNFDYELSSVFTHSNLVSVIVWSSVISIIVYLLTFCNKYYLKMLLLIITFLSSYFFVSATFIYNKSNSISNELEEMRKVFYDIQGAISNETKIYTEDSGLSMKLQVKVPSYKVLVANESSDIENNSFYVTVQDELLDIRDEEYYLLSHYKNAYIWIYGNELKEELISKGYDIEKRKSIAFDSQNGLKKTGKVDELRNEIELNTNEVLYGPFITIPAGKYEVYIIGENLEKAYYEAGYQKDDKEGMQNIEIIDIVTKQDAVQYTILLEESVKKLEFKVHNFSEFNITVDSIEVEKM